MQRYSELFANPPDFIQTVFKKFLAVLNEIHIVVEPAVVFYAQIFLDEVVKPVRKEHGADLRNLASKPERPVRSERLDKRPEKFPYVHVLYIPSELVCKNLVVYAVKILSEIDDKGIMDKKPISFKKKKGEKAKFL